MLTHIQGVDWIRLAEKLVHARLQRVISKYFNSPILFSAAKLLALILFSNSKPYVATSTNDTLKLDLIIDISFSRAGASLFFLKTLYARSICVGVYSQASFSASYTHLLTTKCCLGAIARRTHNLSIRPRMAPIHLTGSFLSLQHRVTYDRVEKFGGGDISRFYTCRAPFVHYGFYFFSLCALPGC